MIEKHLSSLNNVTNIINSISENYKVNNFKLDTKVNEKGIVSILNDDTLENLFKTLDPTLKAYVEFPYVDRLYRDSYYNYYSKRNAEFSRNSIRISFFKNEIESDSIVDNSNEGVFLGFITIRPTLPRRLGRNFLNPKALLDKTKLYTLRCSSKTLINGIKYETLGYPHSSQDGNYYSCAEACLWSLAEYFGNRYSQYSSVLISDILSILKSRTSERQIPTDGLTNEQMSFVLRKLGFASKIFHKVVYKKGEDEFYELINCYIESAIPVILIYDGENEKHANLIIGYEKDQYTKTSNKPFFKKKKINYVPIKDRNYVFIDDNFPPYVISSLDGKLKGYEDGLDTSNISAFIVPHHNKVFLNAYSAKMIFLTIIKHKDFGISETLLSKNDYSYTLKLMPSRTFKEKLWQEKTLPIDTKEFMVSVVMPKFIWIIQFGSLNLLNKNLTDGLIILDSTSSEEDDRISTLLLALYRDKIVYEKPDQVEFEINDDLEGHFDNFSLINNNIIA